MQQCLQNPGLSRLQPKADSRLLPITFRHVGAAERAIAAFKHCKVLLERCMHARLRCLEALESTVTQPSACAC